MGILLTIGNTVDQDIVLSYETQDIIRELWGCHELVKGNKVIDFTPSIFKYFYLKLYN